MSVWQQPWVLGTIAGVTIFLGFPIARVRNLSAKTKAFFNAISTGILIFLLVEIAGHLLEGIEEKVKRAASGQPGFTEALQHGGLFALGFSIGLLGLVWFERRFIGNAKNVAPERRSKQMAMMIAIGLGLHNFSEGLAIGQGLAGGAVQLAWLLAIGFALHNATEGFGIAAPLSGHPVKWRFLLYAGLIAGGPTTLGALIGGWWTSEPVEVFCLSLAAGTILYVIGELLHLGRVLKEEAVVEFGLLTGFFVALITDFALVGAMAHSNVQSTQLLPGAPAIVAESERHKPRHGGFFGDADDIFHYEVLLQDGKLVLYINDDFNRPLDARAYQGKWRVNPDEESSASGDFHPAEDGAYFVGDIPPVTGELLHIEVSVLKGRQWAPMEFYIPRG